MPVEWGATFPDARLAAAVVDRLTYNAHIIQTGTDSYRLRTTRRGRAGKQPTSRPPAGQTPTDPEQRGAHRPPMTTT